MVVFNRLAKRFNLNWEMRNMQRWRFIRYVTLALVLLGGPTWLKAQEPAKNAAAGAAASAPVNVPAATGEKEFKYFAFLSDPAYTLLEQIALWVVLLIAVAGLLYAVALVGQVYGADEGTE